MTNYQPKPHTEIESIAEIEDELIELLESGHQGWDRQAESLIAKAFYGDTRNMVTAYLGKLDAMRRFTDGKK